MLIYYYQFSEDVWFFCEKEAAVPLTFRRDVWKNNEEDGLPDPHEKHGWISIYKTNTILGIFRYFGVRTFDFSSGSMEK